MTIRPGTGMASNAPDVGPVYPSTQTEERKAALLVIRTVFRGHDCIRYSGRCVRPGHSERRAAARELLEILGLTRLT